jgi:TonB-linked SusC/RagA family outer membrane protein
LLVWLIAFAANASFAQTSTIAGVVKDESGAAMPGVSILIKGTARGTTTDNDGKFVLSVDPSDVMVFSFIGYATQEVPVGNQTSVNIALEPSVSALSEVVVTGYQTQRRSDVTGAVASVSLEQSKDIPGGSAMQSLQGKVPGLYITTSGAPNGRASQVNIRGNNSLTAGSPLYVIDGVPTTDPNVFQNLDPNAIESMDVLKDASTASIYGSRAANGVIVVTTKAGKETTSLTFNSNVSVQYNGRRVKMMNVEQLGEAYWRGAVNDGPSVPMTTPLYSFDWNGDYSNPVLNKVNVVPFVGGDPNEPSGDTNWQNEIFRPAVVTSNSLTLTSGTANTNVLANIAHYKNSGTVLNNDFQRINGRLNTSIKFFEGRLRIGENLAISKAVETPVPVDLGGVSVIQLATILQPIIPVKKLDGSYGGPIGGGFSDRNNPVHISEINKDDKNHEFQTFGNLYAELEPIDNLVLRTSFGLEYGELYNVNIERAFTSPLPARTLNSLSILQQHNVNWTWSNTARYNFSFSKSRMTFLAGMEAIKNKMIQLGGTRQAFASEDVNYYVLNAGSGNVSNLGTQTGNQLLSYFGNVGYAYNDKYLASVTLRYDGSSKFGQDNKFGFFPAASVGWVLTKESFMANTAGFLSNLKIRAGFGRMGNQSTIADDARFETFAANYGTVAGVANTQNTGSAYDISGADSGTLPSGFVRTRTANNSLKWETTQEINAGIDFGIIKNRIMGSFDYFSRETKDILVTPPVIGVAGEGSLKTVNGATMKNRGFELSLSYNGQIGKFNYTINGNMSRAMDEVTYVPSSVITSYPNNAEKNIQGRSITSVLGYVTDGLFESAEEVTNSPTQPGKGLGRIRYQDLNGDGAINALDQTWLGTTLPAFTYGLNGTVSYGNWSLTITTRGVQGVIVTDASKNITDFLGVAGVTVNHGVRLLDAWSPQNPTSKIPAISTVNNNNEGRISNYERVNGSYFKIQNTELAYSLPKSVTDKMRMTSFRIYGIADNFLLICQRNGDKAFTGADPENPGANGAPTTTNLFYTRPIRFTLGVDIRF